MRNENGIDGSRQTPAPWTLGKAGLLLAVVAVAWLAFDRLTKVYFDGFEVGQDIAGPFFGLFQFTLVHNTGAAWGIFGGATFALGVTAVVTSVVIAALGLWFAPRCNWVLTLGCALVCAGGIGNAIDRFAQGYVTDFIEFSFIDFPVFNVADIGVTCGMVLAVVAIALFWRGESADPADGGTEAARAQRTEPGSSRKRG